MSKTLFISDLHLAPQRPGTVERFLEFLRERAPGTEALYILGDLFDAWVGDDDERPPVPEVVDALRELTRSGTPVFLQHGNRDFLLGKRFMAATGCTLLEEWHLLELGGIPTLLTHGDLLCSDDTEYLRARAMLRNEAFMQDFLSKPLQERIFIAAEYRKQSGEATSLKAEGIMDVNPRTVEESMRRHGARWLIHGHTHREAVHDFELDGEAAKRIVLGEWHPDRGGLLRVTDGEPAFEAV